MGLEESDSLCAVLKVYLQNYIRCTSGSVVEYRLAKARVAGSNPVSCLQKPELSGFYFIYTNSDYFVKTLKKENYPCCCILSGFLI